MSVSICMKCYNFIKDRSNIDSLFQLGKAPVLYTRGCKEGKIAWRPNLSEDEVYPNMVVCDCFKEVK